MPKCAQHPTRKALIIMSGIFDWRYSLGLKSESRGVLILPMCFRVSKRQNLQKKTFESVWSRLLSLKKEIPNQDYWLDTLTYSFANCRCSFRRKPPEKKLCLINYPRHKPNTYIIAGVYYVQYDISIRKSILKSFSQDFLELLSNKEFS